MASSTVTCNISEIRVLALNACLACGASEALAKSLVEATLAAELEGKSSVGIRHFLDYLLSMKEGRIHPTATPQITHPLPAIIHCDARDGIAQLGFDLAFDKIVSTANLLGVAIFSQSNSYTAGEIGYYVRRLAGAGFIALAAANAHSLMAASAGSKKVFSTNPLAFGVPLGLNSQPLVFDQASSATAFVNILRAAETGASIPDGWALDIDGNGTTDPAKAAAGALLPFGGYKGANIALMVEMLAAGFSGANWSLDAGDFHKGSRPPRSGLTIIVIKPDSIDVTFAERCAEQAQRLANLGVRLPGIGPLERADKIIISARDLETIGHYANGK